MGIGKVTDGLLIAFRNQIKGLEGSSTFRRKSMLLSEDVSLLKVTGAGRGSSTAGALIPPMDMQVPARLRHSPTYWTAETWLPTAIRTVTAANGQRWARTECIRLERIDITEPLAGIRCYRTAAIGIN